MGSEHSSMAERDVAKPPLDAETVESYNNIVTLKSVLEVTQGH